MLRHLFQLDGCQNRINCPNCGTIASQVSTTWAACPQCTTIFSLDTIKQSLSESERSLMPGFLHGCTSRGNSPQRSQLEKLISSPVVTSPRSSSSPVTYTASSRASQVEWPSQPGSQTVIQEDDSDAHGVEETPSVLTRRLTRRSIKLAAAAQAPSSPPLDPQAKSDDDDEDSSSTSSSASNSQDEVEDTEQYGKARRNRRSSGSITCTHCNKSFQHQSQLRTHLRVHTGGQL